MEFIKKLFSAIALSLLVSFPITLLEALMMFSIVNLYEVPYLEKFQYHQILGICFIIMMTRNRIKIKDTEKKDVDLLAEITSLSVNRLFRIIFVWSVALCFHEIFLR